MEEINTIDDLVSRLTNVTLPWDDFCPSELTNWLNVFARSHGTSKEWLKMLTGLRDARVRRRNSKALIA